MYLQYDTLRAVLMLRSQIPLPLKLPVNEKG